MAEVTPELIKEIREKTGIGLMKCKNALIKTGGDVQAAIDELRKEGLASAEKRIGRTTGQGTIFHYIHGGGTIGVLVELMCESDFVARTEDFQNLGKDLCMQVAAAAPQWTNREEVPPEAVEREKSIFKEQVAGK
ncbi:MAG: translation elongation factor Ts, partial [Planctomycetes bacterium]|nr:translation elongation factor Ts [Planctomycetota bacterium]